MEKRFLVESLQVSFGGLCLNYLENGSECEQRIQRGSVKHFINVPQPISCYS